SRSRIADMMHLKGTWKSMRYAASLDGRRKREHSACQGVASHAEREMSSHAAGLRFLRRRKSSQGNGLPEVVSPRGRVRRETRLRAGAGRRYQRYCTVPEPTWNTASFVMKAS